MVTQQIAWRLREAGSRYPTTFGIQARSRKQDLADFFLTVGLLGTTGKSMLESTYSDQIKQSNGLPYHEQGANG